MPCYYYSISSLQVIEPNLRDQVHYPGFTQQQQQTGMATAPPPPPLSNAPGPDAQVVYGHPSSILGPVPAMLPEPTHQSPPSYIGPTPPLMNAPPPIAPPPSSFVPVPPGAAPQFQSMDPRASTLQPHSQTHSSPQPHSIPQPHSHTMPQQTSAAVPSQHMNLGSNSNVSCNVQLPPLFEVKSLFPDEHPQVCFILMYCNYVFILMYCNYLFILMYCNVCFYPNVL